MRIPSSSGPAPSSGTIPVNDTLSIVPIPVNDATTVAFPALEGETSDTESFYLSVKLNN